MNRQDILASLRAQPPLSVLIVGGGINGIGTFRELAAQGVDVLLVEKGDFCSGASAASSHMVHGGLRYLENAEFRLVKEALRERNRLLHNAPHYVKPLPTTIPIFKRFSGTLNAPLKFLNLTSKPAERGALIIKMGLMMYDAFTRGQQGLPQHQLFSRAKSLEKRPNLNPDIIATARYYDAWMPYPERICLELILDTEKNYPNSKAINYVSASKAAGDTVTLKDELTGEEYTVKPQLVINAAGPWIDFANRAMQQPTRFIGGTKGSHLVVDHAELYAATAGEEIFFENKDGRIVLFFPLLDRVLVGTTDIPIENPDQAVCTEEEVDYLLGMIERVFPKLKVDRSHIVFKFSGVRPLPSSDAPTAGQISRDHSNILTPPNTQIHFPIYSLVGGKWTTFRAFSEQVADEVLPRLKVQRTVTTEQMPIGGGKDYPKSETERTQWLNTVQQQTGVSRERLHTLFERYGTRAAEIAAFIAQEKDYPLRHKADYSQREILFIAQQEKLVHLDDLVLRRSLLAMMGYLTCDLLEELAAIVATALDWTPQAARAEIERTTETLQRKHGVTLK